VINGRTDTRLKKEGKGSTKGAAPRLGFSLDTNKFK